MFQLDDKFLEEVGLGSLPAEQREAFLEHFKEQLHIRVGTRLSDGLSDEQMDEFESFMDRDTEKVITWLAKNTPDYQNDDIFNRLKQGAPEGIPEIVILSEYASLKWLGLNRPDYRDVVTATVGELRDEVIANREAILGANDQPVVDGNQSTDENNTNQF